MIVTFTLATNCSGYVFPSFQNKTTHQTLLHQLTYYSHNQDIKAVQNQFEPVTTRVYTNNLELSLVED